ncbi:nitroreductase family protein [Amorphus coralli]|uniref:nitroreductase family protein n=1 Tax=Amorphus coralli TaxID=340680 RepID=UPI0003656C48|nr:nitroreductase [Amorphus coralli]
MTDLLEHLRTRRSVPAAGMTGPGPDAETLRDMLTIAARVPDHGKLAPWRFIVFEGESRTAFGAALAKLVKRRNPDIDEERLEAERRRFDRAPLVVGVVSCASAHPKIPEWEQILSAGAVCMNLIHAAYGHGFAAQWISEWYAFDPEALELLGLETSEQVAGFVHIGTAEGVPSDRPRPTLEAITSHWEPKA